MKGFWLIIFLAGVLAASLHAADRPLRIVALNTVLAEIAREVGGSEVAVNGLVPAGVDPHSFDPSPREVRAIVEADLVLASGLNLEGYLERLTANGAAHGRVLTVGDELPNLLVLISAHGVNERDPHWWHSIDNVILATERVRSAYTDLRPSQADAFARQARVYTERLIALKTWVAIEIAKLPPARRQLVTSHEAFGYFARDYGFTVHALSGLSTEGEPDARHLAHLIDLIRREHIPAVFAESSVNPKVLESLVAETGLRLGAVLYADGLGARDTDAADYDAMYRHNVRTIVDGLLPEAER